MSPCGLTTYREPIVQAIGRLPRRSSDGVSVNYERHRPDQTTLYRLLQEHAAPFIALTEASTGDELQCFLTAVHSMCRSRPKAGQ